MKDSKILTKHPKLKREITLAIVASGAYILSSIFKYHLNKFFPGLPVGVTVKALYVVLFILLAFQIYSVRKRRKKSKGKVKLRSLYYLPACILIIGILYMISPFKLNSEWLEGKVIVKGCYDGGPTRVVIRFRDNKKFEINWIADGDGEIFSGTYEQRKDTMFLSYNEKAPDKFGGVVINDGHNLICVDRPTNPDEYYIIFTIGLCEKYY